MPQAIQVKEILKAGKAKACLRSHHKFEHRVWGIKIILGKLILHNMLKNLQTEGMYKIKSSIGMLRSPL